MPGLADTLATLTRYRRSLHQATAAFTGASGPSHPSTLTEVAEFGANPGSLRMLTHLPQGLKRGAGLVVVLHGCGQTAEGYDHGAGWSTLADRFGFALLLPEQRRANNAGTCFNWFQPEDATRDQGEAASMRAMIRHMLANHPIDPKRVFISGLSAGGAFANVMLATYPELFAGGAIVAGLPYGGARDMQTALAMMHAGQQRSDAAWGDLVRAASPHRGPWPRIAVWHGLADQVVAPVNGTDALRQWLDVHGLADAKPARDTIGPADHQRWRDAHGQIAVESYTLPVLAHGVPISAEDADPAQRCGAPAPFILEAGLSSSYLTAAAWGLAPPAHRRTAAAASGPAPAIGIAAVINKALKAADLGV
jgi:poly(hydroxyalkanoate) depolymerase family esterase